MHFEEKFCDTNFGKICYLEIGEGEKAIVFLHGFLGQPVHMGKISELSNQGFRIIAPYLPSHGKSFYVPKNFTFSNLVSTMDEFLTTFNLSDIYLVAHSLGGAISLALTNKKIKAKILIDPALGPPKVAIGKIPDWLVDEFWDRERFKTKIGRILFPPLTVCFRELLQWPTLLKIIKSISSDLNQKVPVVYLWGEKDAFTPLLEYKEIIKDKNLKIFPGGHHWFHWQEDKLMEEIEKII